MSTYIKKAINPKNKKMVKAIFIDDYFGNHKYGVGFMKNGKDAKITNIIPLEDLNVYREEDVYKVNE